eukprot:scaffold1048_cov90-Amphora_coffeaeformis.AAC.18
MAKGRCDKKKGASILFETYIIYYDALMGQTCRQRKPAGFNVPRVKFCLWDDPSCLEFSPTRGRSSQ